MLTSVAFCTFHARPIGVFAFCVTVPGTAVNTLMSGSFGAAAQMTSKGELAQGMKHFPGGDFGSALPGHCPLTRGPTSDCAFTVSCMVLPPACRLTSSGIPMNPDQPVLPADLGLMLPLNEP